MGKHEHETRCILIFSEGSSAKERSRVERRGGRGGRGSNNRVTYEDQWGICPSGVRVECGRYRCSR
jgi:hypothetical protein